MAQPTQSDAHVDAVLTDISIAFMQDTDKFVATKVFPIVSVDRQSDKYFTYNRDDWFREEARKRAASTESAGSGYELSTQTYTADVWAVHKDIDDQLRANADTVIGLDRDATEWVTRQLLMKMESEWVSAFFSTSLWTGAATTNDQVGVTGAPAADQFLRWEDAASTPIEDIATLMDQMEQKTGFRPNKFVIGRQIETVLKNHPDILDRIKHTQKGVVTMDLVADLLGLEEIIVASATRNTAAEGASDSYSFYFGNDALLIYAAPSASLLHPSAGYQFAWTGYTGTGGVEGIGTGSRMNKMRADLKKSDRIEGEWAMDMKLVAADLGIFFSNAVT